VDTCTRDLDEWRCTQNSVRVGLGIGADTWFELDDDVACHVPDRWSYGLRGGADGQCATDETDDDQRFAEAHEAALLP